MACEAFGFQNASDIPKVGRWVNESYAQRLLTVKRKEWQDIYGVSTVMTCNDFVFFQAKWRVWLWFVPEL